MDLSSFPTRPSLLSSSSGWRDRLQDASFRGVPFKVEEESAGTGRRVETHEYPNRDKPYTEDLGKITFRPSITAYVVGDDCFDQRDRLIDALNKPGPGTLVHPTYGELKVCVDGEVRVSTSKSEGRIVRFDLKFVEAGELSYPTSGAATAQTLMSSCSALDDCISDSFRGFSIDGVADFVQNDVVGNVSTMLGYVSDAMKVVDSAVSDAARLLQGDISVLLPPPSSGKNLVEQVQKMWRTGKRLYGNASDLVTMIKTLSGVSLGSDLQPRGVWKTDSKTTATATQQRNVVASTLRTTAISEAAYAVTRLPAPTTSAVMQNSAVGQATTPAQSTGWPSVTHPALNNAPAVKNTVDLPAWSVSDPAIAGAAPSLTRVHQRADALMRELDPRTTTELINRWERLCGLPDECIPAGTQTLRQRQQRLDAKVNLAGGINEDFYLAQLAALGRPDATITRYDKSTFTCSSACTDAVNAPEWRYYWQVNMPAATNTTWMTCGDPCDSALRIWGDTVVECVLNKLCPSHTYVIFKYPE
ncbi:TPA: DUF2313 domain-containing protein [Escherichia coli]|nr:DUF2313 domain-containing protein [Escherichia coli]